MTTITAINAPSSKSVSHRAFIAASLANGVSNVTHPLNSDDLVRTRQCLEACGAKFDPTENGFVITGMENGPQGANHDGKDKDAEPVELAVGESGTTCRLITAVAAAGKGKFRVTGEGRMPDRPMKEITDALTKLGVKFTFERKDGHLPFIMETKGYQKKKVDITLEESSQYLSGLLLGAALSKKDMTINVTGTKTVSWPYVALTLRAMEDFKAGFTVEVLKDKNWKAVPWRSIKAVKPNEIRFQVQPTGYQHGDYRVEADWSNASYFIAAGAVGQKVLRVQGLDSRSLQGDRAILDILSQMNADIDVDFEGITIRPSKLKGAELDMGKCPDLVPTVAVAAAFADSPTTIRNVAHLRIKESDRLQACADEIAKTGAKTETFEDGLTITPAGLPQTDIDFCTYDDHRMAMSLSIFGLGGVGVKLDNSKCVAKSFPGFFDEWAKVIA